MAKKIKYSFLFIILFTVSVFSQIEIKSLPELESDSLLIGNLTPRKFIKLNNGWKVFTDPNKIDYKKVNIPFILENEESFYAQNEFFLSQDEINNSTIKLFCGGLIYSLDIYLNGSNIFKRSVGNLPFELDLPNDLLHSKSANKITIKVSNLLDSKKTIPLKQSYLFPKQNSGILRSILIKILPKTHFTFFDFSYSLDSKLSVANSIINFSVDNFDFQKGLNEKDVVTVNFKLIPKNFIGASYSYDFQINQTKSKKLQQSYKIDVTNPVLWSPETPNIYKAELSLFINKQPIDVINSDISFFRIAKGEQSLTINNNPFFLKGITYIVNENELIRGGYFEKLKKDFSFIKTAGFNSIRFAKSYPNPLAIKLCNEIGLFSLVELPLNSPPEEFLIDNEFRIRALTRFNEMIESYKHYSFTNIWGVGSSLLSNSTVTEDFISYLLSNKKGSNFITYGSFIGFQTNPVVGLDLLGTEIYSTNPDTLETALERLQSSKDTYNYFLSEINYPNYFGIAGGYFVKNSTEAKAKYYEQIIDITKKNNLSGFFLNTLFDYKGNFPSLYGGNKTNYQLGIFATHTTSNNLVYKVIDAKLNDKGSVTIPIGNNKDENKLIFILIALGLSILMALIINTSRKFRDDCIRAFYRPYNFYSDIRDLRIISGFHTFILLLVEAGSISLLFTILFYYLRTNILFEKILLAFGEPKILEGFSNIAWNPEKSFVIIFLIVVIKIVLLSFIIKGASLSIKTRVFFSSIFFMIIWALLPLTVLLPLELILYKILSVGNYNTLILVFLTIFWIWILLRIFKGIYVLFEINKLKVYFYSLAIILFFIVGISLYFQMTNSTIYYITNTIKQYRLISL